MREILFRGKRIDNNEWVYGAYFAHTQMRVCFANEEKPLKSLIIQDGFCDFGFEPPIKGVEVIPETIGQKWIVSQKEFFGGDLFTAVCSISGSKQKAERICKVIDSDSGFDVAVWHKGEWWGYSFMDFSTAKILGNLTDTPELLK